MLRFLRFFPFAAFFLAFAFFPLVSQQEHLHPFLSHIRKTPYAVCAAQYLNLSLDVKRQLRCTPCFLLKKNKEVRFRIYLFFLPFLAFFFPAIITLVFHFARGYI
jgi:hypothetical protein